MAAANAAIVGSVPRYAHVFGKDSGFIKAPTIGSRLAADCSLRGQGESWIRTWVARLWDQMSQSDDLF